MRKGAKSSEEALASYDEAVSFAADQASVYGGTVEDVFDVIKALARENYTTLDNLFGAKYSGTKEGMEQLLADAEKLSGIKYDASNLNDVIQALQVISENEGTLGNAAKEAEETVSGLQAKLSALQENYQTLLADPTASSADRQAVLDELNSVSQKLAEINGQSKMSGMGDSALGVMKQDAQDANNALIDISNTLGGLTAGAFKPFEGVINDMDSFFKKIQGVDTSTSKSMTNISNSVKKASNDIKTNTKSAATEATSNINGISSNVDTGALNGPGYQLASGLKSGLKSGVDNEVIPYVKTIAPTVQANKGPEEYDKKLLVPNGE